MVEMESLSFTAHHLWCPGKPTVIVFGMSQSGGIGLTKTVQCIVSKSPEAPYTGSSPKERTYLPIQNQKEKKNQKQHMNMCLIFSAL